MTLTLFRISSSPLSNTSISRHLTSQFARNWQHTHSTGQIVSRDLTISDLPLRTAE